MPSIDLLYQYILSFIAQWWQWGTIVILVGVVGKLFLEWCIKQAVKSIVEQKILAHSERVMADYILVSKNIPHDMFGKDLAETSALLDEAKKHASEDHFRILNAILDRSRSYDFCKFSLAFAPAALEPEKPAHPTIDSKPPKQIKKGIFNRLVDDCKIFLKKIIRKKSFGGFFAPQEITYRVIANHDSAAIDGMNDLRYEIYGADPKFVGFRQLSNSPDFNPANQMMLLAMDGAKVIGGLVLSIKRVGDDFELPLENDLKMRLNKIAPDLPINDCNYCELHRMIIHPSYRENTFIISNLIVMALDASVKQKCRFIFIMTDRLRLRMSRRIMEVSNPLSLQTKVIEGLPDLPQFEGVKMAIGVTDLSPYVSLGITSTPLYHASKPL